ncbi:MAG TPA: hypothetical protein DHM37_08560 [Candidatus Cloacimonas sp.]|jgi:protein-tyrosine phosphatase|nr:protein-tyrosine phosphatase [Candidatus Cloacimonadota bacterium]HCX73755.1 hypothetical protein [Candidatus Cloacimonas sp.]
MIDIHTHILPGIDDGSPDMETSLAFLQKMATAGVAELVCTSHYIRNQFHNTLQIRQEKFLQLQQEAAKQQIPIKMHLAAEVYLEPEILNDIKKEQMNIADTKYVLVETDFTGFPINLKELLYQIVRSGYKPILAHPERYTDIKKKPEIAEEFMHRNVLLQVNAGSLLGNYGRVSAKAAWKLIELGYCHFIASDCHCRSGEYLLAEVADLLTKKFDNYTSKLLTEENPKKVINNENIDAFYLENIELGKNNFWNRFKKTLSKLRS